MVQGRHSTYTPAKAEQILDGLASGISLVRVCNNLKIGYSTVMTWLNEHADFQDKYTKVRDAQIDFLAEDLLEIADDESIPPDSRRIRIDARKWYAGKMKAKKYGDKQQVDHSGAVTLTSLIEQSYKKDA